MKYREMIIFALVSMLACAQILVAQNSPNRVGSTSANFLEIGYDPKGIAMGDACVSSVNDISSIYWNPAGLSFLPQNEVLFSYQPWLVDSRSHLLAAGFVVPSVGTFAMSVLGTNYGEMEVTTLELQEGTGETFTPSDLAASFSYGRALTTWFGFGASVKYIYSSIYHTNAKALAADLGVIIKTSFFSSSNNNEGLRIGMSLSNYGTQMRYNGLDLLRSLDIAPDQAGNYKDIQVEYKTDSWELPLIFRVGLSLDPIVLTKQKLTLSVDALHVNNNNESVNIGAMYTLNMPGVAKVFLRGGYRGLFLEDSEFGPTFGFGINLQAMRKQAIQFDYAYRTMGVLGNTSVMGISLSF